MAFKIRDGIREQTTRCMSSFQCLNGETRDVCEIDNCIGEKYSFLKTVKPVTCPYKIPFGFSHTICSCPTRAELYKRYGI